MLGTLNNTFKPFLTNDQLNAQILVFNKFIIFLYMFRALCAHHQEVKLYYTASGIGHLQCVTISDAV